MSSELSFKMLQLPVTNHGLSKDPLLRGCLVSSCSKSGEKRSQGLARIAKAEEVEVLFMAKQAAERVERDMG